MLGGIAVIAVIAATVTGGSLTAQVNGTDVYTIEEDWQLVTGTTDPSIVVPQVTCTISPVDMNTAYCAFDLNFNSQPQWSPGGLQMHTWDPVDPVEIATSSIHTQTMSSNNETVTWTTRMEWISGSLHFRIANGQSDTWGQFGVSDLTQLQLWLPTGLSNLNGYDPNVSLDNSGVSFGGNVVISQTLMAVRYYDINGKLISQITTPQVVHPQQ
jgi:hypothetical protein